MKFLYALLAALFLTACQHGAAVQTWTPIANATDTTIATSMLLPATCIERNIEGSGFPAAPRNHKLCTTWVRIDYASIQTADDGSQYNQTMTYEKFDCDATMDADISIQVYLDNKFVGGDSTPGDMEPIVPNTYALFWEQAACNTGS